MAQSRSNLRIWLGVLLLAVGLLGHLMAANAEGGRALHYRHHIFGWFLLSAVSAILVAILGRFLWKGRHDITLLIVGAMQSVIGLLIYLVFSSANA